MNNNQENFDVKEIKSEQPVDLGSQEKRPKKPVQGWSAPGGKFKFQKKHLLIGVGIIIIIILGFSILTFLKGWLSFSEDKVKLEIIGSQEAVSGEEIEFTVRCTNNNRVDLKDAKLTIEYPQGIYSLEGDELSKEIVELGDILSKKREIKDFKIQLTGRERSIKVLRAKLDYQPANINSRFENSASFEININSTLVGLYLTAPEKAINGEEVIYILDYINNSNQDFSNFKIELSYPSGFTFKTAEPLPAKNNIWEIKELKKNERGTIKIFGILEGSEKENKTITASIFKIIGDKALEYTQAVSVTQIYFISPFATSVTVNGKEEGINLNAGSKLDYKIGFRNNIDTSLSQLVLKAYLEGEMFNFRTLKLKEKGFFDSLNNVIIWSAAGVPSLALLPPNESGEVSFSLVLNEKFPINDFSDKNFQISVRAELETFNVPPQFNLEKLKVEKILTSKLNTNVVLEAKGYYNETTSDISNFGPIPPKANQTTAYTIHWQITNTSNDLKNIVVKAVLPQGIEWQNVYTPLKKGAELTYNEWTKEIVLKIDKIPATTGFLIPVYELVFQVALRPSIIQIGTMPLLINKAILIAQDDFTEETLESSGSAISTILENDPFIGKNGGMVTE